MRHFNRRTATAKAEVTESERKLKELDAKMASMENGLEGRTLTERPRAPPVPFGVWYPL